MRPFEMILSEKLEGAIKAAHGGATVKAAGIDLLDRMKERVESPKTIINLMPLSKQMSDIAAKGGDVVIGALATLQEVADATPLRGVVYAALCAAAGEAATPQVRNRATIGGNLLQKTRCWYLRSAGFSCAHDGKGLGCRAIDGENRYHAIMGYSDCARVHPSNVAPALIVLDAEVSIESNDGIRKVKVKDLYPKNPLASRPEHVVKDGEILTQVRVPAQSAGTRSAYGESREKLSFDWATTSAAVRLVMAGKTIQDASICLSAVAPVPVIAADAAKLLKGKTASRKLFEQAAERAFRDAKPLDKNGYKLPVGKAVLVDTLATAAGVE